MAAIQRFCLITVICRIRRDLLETSHFSVTSSESGNVGCLAYAQTSPRVVNPVPDLLPFRAALLRNCGTPSWKTAYVAVYLQFGAQKRTGACASTYRVDITLHTRLDTICVLST